MVLVGRESALKAIDHSLTALMAGTSGVLRLSGEPGIGKTRLLAELTARADGRGMLVLRGRAAEFEADSPFAMFVDALDDYIAGLGPSGLAGLSATSATRLAAVFPAMADAADAEHALPAERYLVHRAVRSLLDELARPAPLVLALDDLHWADEATAELWPSCSRTHRHDRWSWR